MVDNMDFKEILQDDINNAFLDSSEFAEVHNVNGQEVNIVIDRAKASQYGLTTAQVASLVSMANSGSTATEYNVDGTEIDVTIKYPDEDINYVKDLNHFYLENKSLWEKDFDPSGFVWIDCDDAQRSIVSFERRGNKENDKIVCV